MTAIAARPHVLQLRLSADELEQIRARAGDAPVSTWLRRIALDQPAPERRRRLMRERPLHPQAAELTRHVVWAGNCLRQITAALTDAECQNPELITAALARIDGHLRRVLEATQC